MQFRAPLRGSTNRLGSLSQTLETAYCEPHPLRKRLAFVRVGNKGEPVVIPPQPLQ